MLLYDSFTIALRCRVQLPFSQFARDVTLSKLVFFCFDFVFLHVCVRNRLNFVFKICKLVEKMKTDVDRLHLGLEITIFRITTSHFCDQAESLNSDEIHSSLTPTTNIFIMREI